MNYRIFYEKETGIKVPKDFDIHHIDEDRSNNNIYNLIAIPRKLHQQYHAFNKNKSIFKEIDFDVNLNPAHYFYAINQATKLADIINEIHKFIWFRNSLLDKNTPNVYTYNYNTKIIIVNGKVY